MSACASARASRSAARRRRARSRSARHRRRRLGRGEREHAREIVARRSAALPRGSARRPRPRARAPSAAARPGARTRASPQRLFLEASGQIARARSLRGQHRARRRAVPPRAIRGDGEGASRPPRGTVAQPLRAGLATDFDRLVGPRPVSMARAEAFCCCLILLLCAAPCLSRSAKTKGSSARARAALHRRARLVRAPRLGATHEPAGLRRELHLRRARDGPVLGGGAPDQLALRYRGQRRHRLLSVRRRDRRRRHARRSDRLHAVRPARHRRRV